MTDQKRVIPVIDVTPVRRGDKAGMAALAGAVDTANCEVGFLVVTGHGVPEELIVSMDDVCRAYFTLPQETKELVRCTDPAISRGWMPARSRALARTRGEESSPDPVEFFAAGQPDVPDEPYFRAEQAGINFQPNCWPQQPEEFREVWTSYYQCMEMLAAQLMSVFALALGLPATWFETAINRHCSNLFANYYEAPSTPGTIRLGAHTDYGSLTLLYQDDSPGGLQVRTSSGWQDAPHVPGSYMVNIGDLMARWTNDRWVSTLHRVYNADDVRCETPRLSIPFFHQPNHDAVIEAIPTCVDDAHPPRYQPITSGQNMEAKTRRSFTYG